MKKLSVLIMILAVTSSASYASSFWKELNNSFKKDVNATKQAKNRLRKRRLRKRHRLKKLMTN